MYTQDHPELPAYHEPTAQRPGWAVVIGGEGYRP